jgi:hypothetical protein
MDFGTELTGSVDRVHLMFYSQKVPYHMQWMALGAELNGASIEYFICRLYIITSNGWPLVQS